MEYYKENVATLYKGDARDMSELPDGSVQMVCTSPPFWGLRKYAGDQDLIWGGDGNCEHRWDVKAPPRRKRSEADIKDQDSKQQTHTANAYNAVASNFCSLCGAWKGAYGLEPTPEMYVEHTIEILREIRRVLRKDGVVFWNIGDSYNSKEPSDGRSFRRDKAKVFPGIIRGKRITRGSGRWGGGNNQVLGLKPKDLCLIPFRVAIAAQQDGWWVRSVIIWSKSNPMPESVTDRPTESHEYILMLTKSARYYWDADAVRETNADPERTNFVSGSRVHGLNLDRNDNDLGERSKGFTAGGRNIRSVWEFPTKPYPGAHFAVFPDKLPETCIRAATPEVGCCSKCGAPWERVTERKRMTRPELPKNDPRHRPNTYSGAYKDINGKGDAGYTEVKTLGWRPTCKCDAPRVPSLVLDLFAGAGTTLAVGKREGRRVAGWELSEQYCRLIVERVMAVTPPMVGLYG